MNVSCVHSDALGLKLKILPLIFVSFDKYVLQLNLHRSLRILVANLHARITSLHSAHTMINQRPFNKRQEQNHSSSSTVTQLSLLECVHLNMSDTPKLH